MGEAKLSGASVNCEAGQGSGTWDFVERVLSESGSGRGEIPPSFRDSGAIGKGVSNVIGGETRLRSTGPPTRRSGRGASWCGER